MKKISVALALLLSLGLAGSDVLFYRDILMDKPEITCEEKRGSVIRGEENSFQASINPDGQTCWVTVPISLDNLKLFDELELGIDTKNPSSAIVLELYSSSPDDMLALKKNLWLKAGNHFYSFPYRHSGIDVKPGKIRFRLLHRQNNFHLPRSVTDKPIEFRSIRFQITREGVEQLRRDFAEIFETDRYRDLSPEAYHAASEIRDELKKKSDELFDSVLKKRITEESLLSALNTLYDLRKTAGWRIEFAALNVVPTPITIAWTGGADKIFRDRQFPGSFSVPVRTELARNESESVQVAIFSNMDLKNVTATISELKADNGNVIEKKQLSIAPVGYLKVPRVSYPSEFDDDWVPDPILTQTASCDLQKNFYQPYWIDIRTSPDQAPGLYTGTVEFHSGKELLTRIPLEVKVWNFELPKKLSFPILVSSDFMSGKSNYIKYFNRSNAVIDEWLDYMYSKTPDPSKLSPAAKVLLDITERTREIYLEHRIPFADLYRSVKHITPDWRRNRILENSDLFYLGYDNSKDKIEALRPQVESMRKHGQAGKGIIYGYDENTSKEAFNALKKSYRMIKNTYPEIITSATALDYTYGELSGVTDELDIWIVPPTEYMESRAAAEKARKRGQKVWWYPCNWPFPPDANLLLENTATASRLIAGFMPWKFNVDGFLYYSSTFWLRGEQDPCFLRKWREEGGAKLIKFGEFDFYDDSFELKTDKDTPRAAISQQAALNQPAPRPVTVKADLDIRRFGKDSKGRLFFDIRFTYADKSTERFSEPVSLQKGRVKFMKTYRPVKPVKNVFYAFRVNHQDADVLFSNGRLFSEGMVKNRTNPVFHAFTGGPLIPEYWLNMAGSNGDGSLFYPGSNDIIPSIRVKCLRDGLEDYEYLVLLKKAIGEVESKTQKFTGQTEWLNEAKSAIVVSDEICSSLDVYAMHGKKLQKYRSRIGNLLDLIAEKEAERIGK